MIRISAGHLVGTLPVPKRPGVTVDSRPRGSLFARCLSLLYQPVERHHPDCRCEVCEFPRLFRSDDTR